MEGENELIDREGTLQQRNLQEENVCREGGKTNSNREPIFSRRERRKGRKQEK